MFIDSVVLRPPQIAFWNAINAELRTHRKVLAVASTGFGKRLLAVRWASKTIDKGRRMTVITDRRILVDQMATECKRRGVPCGIMMGDVVPNYDAPVQVASIQTLRTRDYRFFEQWETHGIIVDEAHKEPAAYAKAFEAARVPTLGFSATPVGPAGCSIVPSLYDVMAEPVKNSELVADRWLLPVTVWAPSEPDVDGIGKDTKAVPKSNKGEYNQEKLAEAVERCTHFPDVFDYWRPYFDCQTLAFVPTRAYARGLRDQFNERGYKAELIDSGTQRKDRMEIIEAFENRSIRILISVDVLKEGFDAPIAECGIDLQPNTQIRTWWQKIGRIKRPYEDQPCGIWLDFAGNYYRHWYHPDNDVPWEECTDSTSMRDIVQQTRSDPKCRKCGKGRIINGFCSVCAQPPEPWRCPKCGQVPDAQRIRGACPNCGEPIKEAKRRIRMGDGKMRTITAKATQELKKDADQKLWNNCIWRAHMAGQTLNAARGAFMRKKKELTGREIWPDPSQLKECPAAMSMEWEQAPISVFPYKFGKRRPKKSKDEA